MVSKEQYFALGQRWGEALQSKDWDALREMLTPDVVIHEPGVAESHGREEYIAYLQQWTAAFSDYEETSDVLLIDGDWIATKGKSSAKRKSR